MTDPDYPFTVDGGGPPSMFTGYWFTGAILRGDLTAHHGVTIGVGDELVYRWSNWDTSAIYDEEDVAGWMFMDGGQ